MNEWRADEQLLAVLHHAARTDDDDTYLSTLLDISLVMPREPDSQDWAVAEVGESTVVVVYSSVEAMHASPVGDTVAYVVWPVLDLLHAWPDPQWSLLIDATLDTQVQIEPNVVTELAGRAAAAYPLDAGLRAAGGHPRTYLKALIDADIVLPIRPKGSPSRDLANPSFGWWHIGDTDATLAVMVFSSPVRLHASLGDVPWLIAPFRQVLAHWPDGWAAVVDPDHHLSMWLPAEAMAGMAVALDTGR